MLSVDEARRRVLEEVSPLGFQRLMLGEALGRVAAETVLVPTDLPPFPASLVDGYALRWNDLVEVTPGDDVTLEVCFEVPAGRPSSRTLVAGMAARIMTGAVLPEGADTVIMQEEVRREANHVTFRRPPGDSRPAHVCQAGEFARARTPLLSAGQVLHPGAIGVLASIGRCQLLVYRCPRVAVVATGDELVEIDEPPGAGQIRDSASYTVAALVRLSGGIPLVLPRAPDDLAGCRSRLADALGAADMVITIGGVSVGDYDVVRLALEELGLAKGFWRVAMKPGKPLAFGTIASKPVFALPGNPVSAFVSFHQFVSPAIFKAAGRRGPFTLAEVHARLEREVRGEPDRRQFLRGRLTRTGGEIGFLPYPHQGSGNLLSLLDADGLGIIPQGVDRLEVGESITVQLLPQPGCWIDPAGS